MTDMCVGKVNVGVFVCIFYILILCTINMHCPNNWYQLDVNMEEIPIRYSVSKFKVTWWIMKIPIGKLSSDYTTNSDRFKMVILSNSSDLTDGVKPVYMIHIYTSSYIVELTIVLSVDTNSYKQFPTNVHVINWPITAVSTIMNLFILTARSTRHWHGFQLNGQWRKVGNVLNLIKL